MNVVSLLLFFLSPLLLVNVRDVVEIRVFDLRRRRPILFRVLDAANRWAARGLSIGRIESGW